MVSRQDTVLGFDDGCEGSHYNVRISKQQVPSPQSTSEVLPDVLHVLLVI